MKLLIVDAFTDRPFAGNPAAVCLLDEQRDAEWMQSVAAGDNWNTITVPRGESGSYSKAVWGKGHYRS